MTAPASPPDTALTLPPAMALRKAMGGRDAHEAHRTSTPLELLFDLSAVVAVAAAVGLLHHGLAAGEPLGPVLWTLVQAFFYVWWPWMSYTWFASAYDTDDVAFRLATLLQMSGVLLIAVGLQQGHQGEVAAAVGFGLMRLTLVVQWWRASREDLARRATCLRYAGAIGVIQLLWLARAWAAPEAWSPPLFVLLMLLEMAVPVWAARSGDTPWHAHHIAERYGLLTLILLGECVMAAVNAMAGVIQARGWSVSLVGVALGIVGLLMTLWWAYFLVPFPQVLHQRRERAFVWGYGHAIVFAALVALGAGLELVADALAAGGQGERHVASASLAIAWTAVSVVLFMGSLWWLGGHTTRRLARSPVYLLPVLVGAVAAVGVVWLWRAWPAGLLLLGAGPALMIAWITRDRHLQPERFAVR
ncbi:low temperature requirement protein A [Ideonella margarita]|uniref:Low temperature requirement protein A n=1 Tax=Ideonella margarita TaxID=2984191 RepID=A0ABU9C321_9BURK